MTNQTPESPQQFDRDELEDSEFKDEQAKAVQKPKLLKQLSPFSTLAPQTKKGA